MHFRNTPPTPNPKPTPWIKAESPPVLVTLKHEQSFECPITDLSCLLTPNLSLMTVVSNKEAKIISFPAALWGIKPT